MGYEATSRRLMMLVLEVFCSVLWSYNVIKQLNSVQILGIYKMSNWEIDIFIKYLLQ